MTRPTGRPKGRPLGGKNRPRSPRPAARIVEVQADRWVVVDLTTRHSVNGTSYGPGATRVRESIAKQFREAEQRMLDNERAMLTPQAAIIQLGYGGARVIRVSPHLFDQALNSEQFVSAII